MLCEDMLYASMATGVLYRYIAAPRCEEAAAALRRGAIQALGLAKKKNWSADTSKHRFGAFL
jgi:hypothetical protein